MGTSIVELLVDDNSSHLTNCYPPRVNVYTRTAKHGLNTETTHHVDKRAEGIDLNVLIVISEMPTNSHQMTYLEEGSSTEASLKATSETCAGNM